MVRKTSEHNDQCMYVPDEIAAESIVSTHVWYADCSESLPDVAASPRNARKKRQISQAKVSANTARQSGGCFNFRRSICFHSPHSHDGDLGPPQLVEQRRHVFQVAVRYVAAGEPPATDSSRKSVYFKGCIRNQLFLHVIHSSRKEVGCLHVCVVLHQSAKIEEGLLVKVCFAAASTRSLIHR